MERDKPLLETIIQEAQRATLNYLEIIEVNRDQILQPLLLSKRAIGLDLKIRNRIFEAVRRKRGYKPSLNGITTFYLALPPFSLVRIHV